MVSRLRSFTLIELLFVVAILAVVVAILLPSLGRAKSRAMLVKMSLDNRNENVAMSPAISAARSNEALPQVPHARVSAFGAQIELAPRLSVGTAEAESIYEARFKGTISASAPSQSADCQILFPLPPQIISLADLTFKINGEPSDTVMLEQGRLVWHGKLPQQATPIELTYTAVGKGVYALEIPPGGKLESFNIDLASVGSDVRMLDLSLQPTKLERVSGRTHYTWDYKNLYFGRPIALDVLGIAPIDRLGELAWLGPLSVVAFGLLIGLFARAFDVMNFDRWMLLLIIGTFTGAYPLMYFAQEYTYPMLAIALSAAIVILIIAIRAITLMGWGIGLLGGVAPAAIIMTMTLAAALEPRMQGILLTIGALGFFIVAMILAPRLKAVPNPFKNVAARIPSVIPPQSDTPMPA